MIGRRAQIRMHGGAPHSPGGRARGRSRTRDIFITSEVLYQLSYSGENPILGRPRVGQEKRELLANTLVKSALCH
jgi:hypothetical protein